MIIFQINRAKALGMWVLLSSILSAAMEYEDGKYTLDDVKGMVADDDAQVWVAIKDSTIYGVAITQIIDYPQKSMVLVLCLAGKRFDLWDNIVNDCFVPFAKYMDCSGIEFYGRKGWERRAARLGFKTVQRVYELAVKDDSDARLDGHVCHYCTADAKLH